MSKCNDYFGSPIDFDDLLVAYSDFKSGAYLKDKSLIFKQVGDTEEIVSLVKNKRGHYNVGDLYNMVHGDMAVIIKDFIAQ